MRLPEAISMKLRAHTEQYKKEKWVQRFIAHREKQSQNTVLELSRQVSVVAKRISGKYYLCILTHTSLALRVKQSLRSEFQVFREPHVDINLKRDPITTHHKIKKNF